MEHDLFYHIDPSGKKVLSITCPRTEKFRPNGSLYLTKSRWPIEPNEQGLEIGEEWSAGWAKKKQLEQSFMLPLTHNLNLEPNK
jgi:hypothetical protein